ncbi:hypothetical protein Syun_028912 [Stephania yunnanensis]|uniref:Uncharacterized protein n=1 Tax=Stephania yunnanensis TaxID=152371 RepID=A0AAP0HFK3_9MAGN
MLFTFSGDLKMHQMLLAPYLNCSLYISIKEGCQFEVHLQSIICSSIVLP